MDKEEYEALLRDRERLDWLETQDCWIGLKSDFYGGAVPKRVAGKNFRLSVREACDEGMEPQIATPASSGPEPVDEEG